MRALSKARRATTSKRTKQEKKITEHPRSLFPSYPFPQNLFPASACPLTLEAQTNSDPPPSPPHSPPASSHRATPHARYYPSSLTLTPQNKIKIKSKPSHHIPKNAVIRHDRRRAGAEEEGGRLQGWEAQDARGGAGQERSTFVRGSVGRGDAGQGAQGDCNVRHRERWAGTAYKLLLFLFFF